MELRDIKSLLLDGDGVLYYSDKPADGVDRFFKVLEERGINWAMITNNSTKTRDSIVNRLGTFGISASPEQIFTSSTVTASKLLKHYGADATFYVVGESGLMQILGENGFALYHNNDKPERVDAVIVGLDRDFTYEKLQIASRLIQKGAEFVACNTDRQLPVTDGFDPGAGAMIVSVMAVTDVDPVIMGKPQPAIYDEAMEFLGADKETTAVVGDRLETDILGGVRMGIGSILTLAGATEMQAVVDSEYKPDFIFDDISKVATAFEQADRNLRYGVR